MNTKHILQKIFTIVINFLLLTVMAVGLSSVVLAQSGPADIELPSDVENLQAVAKDSSVTLSWDVANDNVGVEGYKIYYGDSSVTNEGGTYPFTLEVGDVIEYDVKELDNDTEYYFAVTAYDKAGNESENYSFEVPATPKKVKEIKTDLASSEDDGRAPTVKSIEGYSNVQIKVTFSEEVVLPDEEPQTAFLVEDNLTGEFLPLLDAEVLNSDNRVVIIETAPQDDASEYVLTAGIVIEDKYGNSIRSGTSDTATFLSGKGEYKPVNVPTSDSVPESLVAETSDAVLGDATNTLSEGLNSASEDLFGDLTPEEKAELEKSFKKALKEGDISGGVVLEAGDVKDESSKNLFKENGNLPDGIESVKAVSETQVEVKFLEPVTLMESQNHFLITEKVKDNPLTPEVEEGALLSVVTEELKTDETTVLLEVDGMKPGKDYMLSIVNTVTAGGVVIDSGEGIEFQAKTIKFVDVIPPEEITNLLSNLMGSFVKLTWDVSVSEDAVEQIVYESTDGINYLEKVVLPPLVSEFKIGDLVEGMTYWFKITSKDAAGNESKGVVTEVTLPETGPGLALMFGISALGTAVTRRRKKRY